MTPQDDLIEKEITCWLESDMKQCCCKCKHHLQDFHHCTTSRALRAERGKCVCSAPKGWICRPPEFDGQCYSDWPEHSVGCEMYEEVKICSTKQTT